MKLVLVHGWGFSPRFWDAMAAHLPACARLDFGFFGPADVSMPDTKFWLVGHSYGALWGLLNAPLQCAGVIAINGFAQFAGGRALDRMIARFDAEPEAALAAFLARCGAVADTRGLNAPALASGLKLLRDGDARGRAPLLAIQGARDPIVEPSNFEPAVVLGGGHLLPLTHAAECAALVLGVAR